MFNLKQLITFLFLVVISQNAWCWGTQGHMIVAQIGEDNLTPKAKKEEAPKKKSAPKKK